jgi:TetR/AcrR family transcriptional regulator, transcriptional repressor of bet genes
MIWRVVSRYAELSGRPTSMTPAAAYGVLDGLFQQARLGHLTDASAAEESIAAQVHELMPLMLRP